MALYSCNASVIGRASGRSAVASAAYRAGAKLVDERQGVVWDFTKRRGVLHGEIVLPQSAPAWAADRERLWNEAERRESGHAKQDTARVARDFRIALPHEATPEQRLAITREFSQYLADRYGGAVDFAMHMPDRHGDDRNFHAHVMLTSRRMTADGFGVKIRELDDKRQGPKEIDHIRQSWEDIQNRLLDQLGIDRVSCKSLAAQGFDREATVHLGVSANAMERKGELTDRGDLNREIEGRNMERQRIREAQAEVGAKLYDLDAERAARQEKQAIRAEAQTLDPARILAAITERRATFTRAELNSHLREILPDAMARSAFTDRVLAAEGVIPLREDAKAPVSRYTTAQVLSDERRATDAAGRLAGRSRHGVNAARLAETLDQNSHLDHEQRAALNQATGPSGLAIIAGEAGTGKSTTLSAIREAYEDGGYRVTGMAWKNDVVQSMRHDGFAHAVTVKSELMRHQNGRSSMGPRSVLIVDEAAMIDTRHLAALLTAADQAGAKVILAGDERQLSSIERGGIFGLLQERHGASELHHVRRVKDEEQRDAFNLMHRGDFRGALDIFDRRGAIQWSQTPEKARAALVEQWARDTAAEPGKARFVLAYTNAEVAELNRDLRAIRKARGELGEDHDLETRDGPQPFAVNDRIQFVATARDRAQRDAGMTNGAAGTIEAIDGTRVTVALDTRKGAPPRVVSFNVGSNAEAGEFDGFRHGLAGTVWKSQGGTRHQTYLLHSDYWRASTGYVALSRHSESVLLFAAEKGAAWMMAAGGEAGLNEKQHQAAERSFATWSEAKPELAARYGFADYVAYVQGQCAEQKDMHRLDRMARQMSRTDETRAASHFVQGPAPIPETQEQRKPPLSIVVQIVGDYLKLCYDPAKDWLRWVAEDLRGKAAARHSQAEHQQGRSDEAEVSDTRMEAAGRVRPDVLPKLQGGLDPRRDDERRNHGRADNVPARPGRDHSWDDVVRPVRRQEPVKSAADDARDWLRDELEAAERKSFKRRNRDDGPDRGSGMGRGRPRGRDR